MKNVKIILLIAVVCLGALGLMSCDFSYYSSWANYEDYLVGDADFASKDVNTVEIDWISGEIEIVPADVQNVTIKEQGNRKLQENEQMRYLLSDGVLNIKFAAPKLQLKNLDLYKTLQVLVPQDLSDDWEAITINAVSTDTKIANIIATNMDIKSVSGKVEVDTCQVVFCNIAAVSGDIDVVRSKIAGLVIESISGEISVGNCEVTDISAELTSGDLHFTPTVMPTVIKVDAISAKVNLTLPDKGFALDFSTVSGEMENSFDALAQGKGKYVYGDGQAKIDVSTVSGDLFISKL